MIKTIYDLIAKNDLSTAFEAILTLEKELSNDSIYWCLRGDLCCQLNEFNLAIDCYKKSISLNILNTIPFSRLLELEHGFNNLENVEYYNNTLASLLENLPTKVLQFMAQDLNILTSKENLSLISDKINFTNSNIFYLKDNFLISKEYSVPLPYYFDKDNNFLNNSKVVIPLDLNYIENVHKLINYNIKSFSVLMVYNSNIYMVDINKAILDQIKKQDRDRTIAFHILNEGDSNVFGLCNNIPQNLKDKYNKIVLTGIKDYNIFNMAIIPLLASVSVSGHELFLSYPCPELMHNIEVGHGSMPLKACGKFDKLPNFAFSPHKYKKVDTLCVLSQLDSILWSSFTEINPNKILISGVPRTDTLLNTNGRKNLEKLLKKKLDNTKIIFNMPTFHTHENSGRVNGDASLDDFIKIPNFNYKKFDKFLGDNNCICILKVHHAEQSIISKRNTLKNYNNIYAISNLDLQKQNLDLYEIINAGDALITDYSTIYNDFLFMNKPIVFTNYDIDDYRNNRGLALEPYDFWTAGPKVQKQDDLEQELLKSLTNPDYYAEKRKELKSVFFKYDDNNSSKRIWKHIDSIIENKNKK